MSTVAAALVAALALAAAVLAAAKLRRLRQQHRMAEDLAFRWQLRRWDALALHGDGARILDVWTVPAGATGDVRRFRQHAKVPTQLNRAQADRSETGARAQANRSETGAPPAADAG